jgi:hypothetical protein
VTDAFNTSASIDNIDIAFGDRVGGAFRQASAASNAVIVNFHSHSITLLFENEYLYLYFFGWQVSNDILLESGQLCHVFM